MPASSTSMSSPIELDNMPINQPVESVLVNPLVSPSKPKRPWGASQVLAKFKGNKLKSPKPVVPESDLIEEEISEEPLPDYASDEDEDEIHPRFLGKGNRVGKVKACEVSPIIEPEIAYPESSSSSSPIVSSPKAVESNALDEDAIINDFDSPDTCVLKTEFFNLDIASWIQQTQPILAEEKKRIRGMLKSRVKGNQLEVRYILGSVAKQEQKGRWFAKAGVGLQGLSRDVRNALAQDYYWDIDFNNCQVEIMRQMAQKKGWVHAELDRYCENRKQIFEEIQKELNIDRDEVKTIFISLLFGGNRKTTYPVWVKDKFYPEVQAIMDNICKDDPAAFKKASKTKSANPKGSCCATILQTEERHCLEALDRCLAREQRSLDVYIHDGGYVKKNSGEKVFPEGILRNCEKYVQSQTGYKLALSIKPIETTFIYPGKVEVPQELSYDAMKINFELTHFKLVTSAEYIRISDGQIIHYSHDKVMKAYKHLQYKDIDPKHPEVLKGFQFIGRWVSDEHIRVYDFMGMFPPPLRCPLNYFNLWSGLAIEEVERLEMTPEVESDVTFLLQHIMNLCNGEDLIYEFALDFIHTLFKYPGKRLNMSLLFKACSGFGKEWLFNILEACIGSKYCLLTVEIERDIIGNFNEALEGKLLVVIDEMKGKTGFKNSDKIKAMITRPTMTVDHKYGQKLEGVPNYVHWMFFADRGFPVEIEAQDRRFLAVHASGSAMVLEDIQRFLRLVDDKVVLRAFYDQIIDREDCKDDWAKRRPDSDLMTDLKANSIPRELSFLMDLAQDWGKARDVSFAEIYRYYKAYLIDCCSGKGAEGLNHIHLGLVLKSFNLRGFKRTRDGGRKGTSYYLDPREIWQELLERRIISAQFVTKTEPVLLPSEKGDKSGKDEAE